MSDITKCMGTDCSAKDTCRRHTAPSSQHRQAWFVVVPMVNGECTEYLPEPQPDWSAS